MVTFTWRDGVGIEYVFLADTVKIARLLFLKHYGDKPDVHRIMSKEPQIRNLPDAFVFFSTDVKWIN